MPDYSGLDCSNLFCFDDHSLRDEILLEKGAVSRIEYDEYVVYEHRTTARAARRASVADTQLISYKFNQDETPGSDIADLAFRQGYAVDEDGVFSTSEPSNSYLALKGRVRRVVCFRIAQEGPYFGRLDGLTINSDDLDMMDLHPATLPYSRRTTTEGRFWSLDRSRLSLILAFSTNPRTPYDFLSMTYDVRQRVSTVLVRQSYHPRRHEQANLDEYDDRMEACRTHWAHPFIMPVVLLQVQFGRTEEAIIDNMNHVRSVEWDVHNIAGFEDFEMDQEKKARMTRRFSQRQEDRSVHGPMNMAGLMKNAHDVLKESIKLLDTVRWMERVVKLLLQAGDELSETMSVRGFDGRGMSRGRRRSKSPQDDEGETEKEKDEEPRSPGVIEIKTPKGPGPDVFGDPLGMHWHEIRQYLEGLLRMCMTLETDRRMSEARCRAQIDIIYSKMAQEDNVLNARMAVASSRDSSSMKALAVITAIFLPGEYLSTLFGMSMFDWQASGEDALDGPSGPREPGTSTNPEDPIPVLSHLFWVYWVVAIPLTLGILCIWRAWWVGQDRYFRRHLSKELSEERYWTRDGKPRRLEHSFAHDFFFLSARRDEEALNDPPLETDPSLEKDMDDPGPASPHDTTTLRQRQHFLSLRRDGSKNDTSAEGVASA